MRVAEERDRPLTDRADAGRQLARRLTALSNESWVVLALPRGGVPVGFEIARSLGCPLDVLIVRKIGSPGNEEYGLGAVVEGGLVALDRARARESGCSEAALSAVIERERAEVERRTRLYRDIRPRVGVQGRTVVVVDDGAATGGTLVAALRALEPLGPRRRLVALGVAPPDTCRRLQDECDELHVLRRPERFFAVGQYFVDFEPVEEAAVLDLLKRSLVGRSGAPASTT